MLDIKFRGKSLLNGKWVYGYYVKHELCTPPPLWGSEIDKNAYDLENTVHYIFLDGFSDWNLPRGLVRVEVMGETVGQFTGYYDKNKKPIFHGDIVSLPDRYSGDHFYKASQSHVDFEDGFYVENQGECSTREMEIIGSVHD